MFPNSCASEAQAEVNHRLPEKAWVQEGFLQIRQRRLFCWQIRMRSWGLLVFTNPLRDGPVSPLLKLEYCQTVDLGDSTDSSRCIASVLRERTERFARPPGKTACADSVNPRGLAWPNLSISF